MPSGELKKLRLFVDLFYSNGSKMPPKPKGLNLGLGDYKKPVQAVEAAAVEEAEKSWLSWTSGIRR